MKILYIADGRSPTALNWLRYFVNTGAEVHMVSLFPYQSDLNLVTQHVIPVAFSKLSGINVPDSSESEGFNRKFLNLVATPKLRTLLRHWFVPRSLPRAADILASLIHEIQPDIVHAMRVPYEGMLAALAKMSSRWLWPALLISIWGNDFTLHAPATRKLKYLTRLTLELADSLHTDCCRDQGLAQFWGFNIDKPSIVLPGSGGIQLDIFSPAESQLEPVVINPRGFRTYVRNDSFFRAIPMVLSRYPGTKFLCPAMANHPEAQKWVKTLGIDGATDLLPIQTRYQMAGLFRDSQVMVSPSTHDGSPNTVLEAMACGCLPVVGDLESLREWITPGVNGFLVDPNDPQALASAICEALENSSFRTQARKINIKLIQEKAEYYSTMKRAYDFYHQIIHLK